MKKAIIISIMISLLVGCSSKKEELEVLNNNTIIPYSSDTFMILTENQENKQFLYVVIQHNNKYKYKYQLEEKFDYITKKDEKIYLVNDKTNLEFNGKDGKFKIIEKKDIKFDEKHDLILNGPMGHMSSQLEKNGYPDKNVGVKVSDLIDEDETAKSAVYYPFEP